MVQQACQNIREELIACVLRSDCVLKSNNSVGDCISTQHRPDLPAQCQHLITTFTDCKRGMLDMRRRFRGNHLSTQEEKKESGVVGGVVVDGQGR